MSAPTTIKVTLERTRGWLHEQRIERGANVPESLEVSVDVAELPKSVRAIILDDQICGGGYPTTLTHLEGEFTHKWSFYCNKDACDISNQDIADAILAAHTKREAKKRETQELVARREKRLSEERAENQAKQEAHRAREEAKLQARELLSAEFKAVERQRDESIETRDTLFRLCSHISEDVLDAAIADMVANDSQDAAQEYRSTLFENCPAEWDAPWSSD